MLVMIAAEWVLIAQHPIEFRQEIGGDFGIYMEAARRWLAGGSFYAPYQLAGPYEMIQPAVLYPPILPLLVPFTVLPAALWWIIPIGITVVCIAKHRPAAWSWPLMLAGLAWWQSSAVLINGTPTLWVLAAVALATHWGWPGALVLVKPSVAPLALLGIRSRGWWIAAGAMATVSLLLFPLWLDWLTAIHNGTGSRANVLYSLVDAPTLAVPIWAWLGRRRGPSGSIAPLPVLPELEGP